MYCDDLNSKKRKECVIVLNIILDCLLKWFAPILVFTTDEIFDLLNKDKGSIHLTNFPNIPSNWLNENLDKKWKDLFAIKQKVNIAIEEKRAQKEIGSSLEADVSLYLKDNDIKLLEGLDLEEYFITSKVNLQKSPDQDMKIEVKRSSGSKCTLCWKILEKKCERKNCGIS